MFKIEDGETSMLKINRLTFNLLLTMILSEIQLSNYIHHHSINQLSIQIVNHSPI